MLTETLKKAAVAAFAGVALTATATTALAATEPVAPGPVVAPGPIEKPAPGDKPGPHVKPNPDDPEPAAKPGATDKPKPGDKPEAPKPPKARLSVTPDSGCAPLKVTLDASKSSGEIINYHFTFPGGGAGSKSAVYQRTITTPGDAEVGVEVGDSGGRHASETKTVHVKPADDPSCGGGENPGGGGDIPGKPTVSLQVTPNPICTGERVTMTASATADTEHYDSISGYEFAYEGNTQPTSVPRNEATLNGSGAVTVSVTVKTSSGQTASDSVTVTVKAAEDPSCKQEPQADPVAHGRGDYEVTCDLVTVRFTGEGSTGENLAYAWDFDDNGTTDATGRDVTHTFGVGTHHVTMTVTDGNGKSDTTHLEELVVDRCPVPDPADPVYYPAPNFAG